MRYRWTHLNRLDRAVFRVTTTFLKGRLEERMTIDWALQLKPNDTIKRLALLELIDSPDGQNIGEPWRTAWRLIEESWKHSGVEDEDNALMSEHHIRRQLQGGDRSGSLITKIMELVEPRLQVKTFSGWDLHFRPLPKQPKRVEDLFKTELTSGEFVDLNVFNLDALTDKPFLVSLAHALDAAVVKGLDIARRTGWDEECHLWWPGGLHRVYYVPVAEHADGEHDPDRYNRGIAPSVKLLHAVVARLVDIDISTAVGFVRRWELINSPIHLRLWAALSRDARITPANEVSVMLLSLDDWRFWDITHYPEIAELRAKRFSEFAPSEQAKLTSRIRKSPPRNQWPKKADPRQIKNARQYWTVLELRRIEIAGACLPRRDKVWLDTRINNFPELVQMVRLDYGFVKLPEADIIGPNPDNRFDLLDGKRRLEELEAALSATRSGWYDEPAPRAAAWIWQPGNSLKLLVDLVSINDGGTNFARVWDLFGRAHSPRVGQDEDAAQRDLPMESARVLSLLVKLPEATIRQAVDGISQWLCVWGQQLILMPEGQSVWLKLWPIAVEVTNATQPAAEKETYLNTVMEASDDRETMETDTLNSPVGKFVSVFLAACPNLQENAQPFDGDGALRRMRDAIIASTGFSKLIAQYRMIECLPYFLNAAPDWTHEHLIAPLTADNSEAIALWRAIARRTQFSDVLKIIGDQMAERATDPRLSRETRRSLVFSLVIECLHAFNEQREPAVPYARTQQMIRSLDDEVRAHAAAVVRRFVRDISASSEEGQTSPPENIFRTAALPFLQQVWPQERSLATPGVSRSLAALPATARGAFAEAVDTIERFLVPFECWAMSDYGFSSEAGGNSGLSIVNNPEKAAALLRLLDLTIGTDEGAMIPYDLAEALNQICRVAPNLAENQVFRRLSTVARRG